MTSAGTHLARQLAALLDDLREHDKREPIEADLIVCTLVAHLRSWRPESVSPLGTLPEPGEPNVDPRGRQ